METKADKLIRLAKWRSNPISSNIEQLLYFDDIRELVIEFIGGGVYTYFDVPFGTYLKIKSGQAQTKVAYGGGKTPSVGAAVHQYLIEAGIEFKKGGNLR